MLSVSARALILLNTQSGNLTGSGPRRGYSETPCAFHEAAGPIAMWKQTIAHGLSLTAGYARL